MNEKKKQEVIERITLLQLFLTFSQLSLCGFGGVGPWVHTFIVEKRGWMNNEEFTELLSLGQVLPGANVTNFAAMFGYRAKGKLGAVASLAGLLFFPFILVIALAILNEHYGHITAIQGSLRGILTVASGMILLTGIKLAIDQRNKNNVLLQLLIGMLTLFGILYLNLSLPLVVISVLFLGIFLNRKNT